ncbi:MAG: hypothetical protein AB4911_19685 [Oscillochloridaceae bacterium umkhey_bin13]
MRHLLRSTLLVWAMLAFAVLTCALLASWGVATLALVGAVLFGLVAALALRDLRPVPLLGTIIIVSSAGVIPRGTRRSIRCHQGSLVYLTAHKQRGGLMPV